MKQITLEQYYTDDMKCECGNVLKSLNGEILKFAKDTNTIILIECEKCNKENEFEILE